MNHVTSTGVTSIRYTSLRVPMSHESDTDTGTVHKDTDVTLQVPNWSTRIRESTTPPPSAIRWDYVPPGARKQGRARILGGYDRRRTRE